MYPVFDVFQLIRLLAEEDEEERNLRRISYIRATKDDGNVDYSDHEGNAVASATTAGKNKK